MRSKLTIRRYLERGLLDEARALVLRELVADGGVVSATATRLGVARSTVYRWMARCDVDGVSVDHAMAEAGRWAIEGERPDTAPRDEED